VPGLPKTGLGVEQVGAFGDSFAPVTAFFAWVAAVGAWLSFASQREQLKDQRAASERQRKWEHEARFDDLFFRLVAEYEAELAHSGYVWIGDEYEGRSLRLIRGLEAPAGDHKDPYAAMQEVYDAVQAQRRACESENLPFSESQMFRHILEKWLMNVGLMELSLQIVATLRWLYDAGKEIDVKHRGRLLGGKLSRMELWFWQMSIAPEIQGSFLHFCEDLGLFPVAKRGSSDVARTMSEILIDRDAWQEEVVWRNPF